MRNSKTKGKNQKDADNMRSKGKPGSISYRLKCAKTANGLSHFAMYGDVPKEKTLI